MEKCESEVCCACPRNCGVNRKSKNGFCKAGENIVVSLYSLHKWEEPCISGENGSGTIFFSGCNLKCVYCQNYEISNCVVGNEYNTQQIVDIFKKLEKMGATNINLVTPTHFANQLLEVFKIYKPKIPVVYNTSGYEKVETLKLLDRYIDIYLVDYKYFDNDLAKRLSNVGNYKEVALEAIKFMTDSKVDVFDENGMMKSGVIIRHLILPNHIYNTYCVLDSIKENFPNRLVSLMAQYVPKYKALELSDISRKITKKEYEKAVEKFLSLKLDGFVQEMSSADDCFIPNFNIDS